MKKKHDNTIKENVTVTSPNLRRNDGKDKDFEDFES